MDTRIRIKLRRVSEELLPLLIGQFVFYGIDPQQYLETLNLENKTKVIKCLVNAGYAVGTPENWRLSKEVLATSQSRLLCASGENKDAPISVTGLVKGYKKLAAKTPNALRKQRVTNTFAFFRRLSKNHSPKKIEAALKQFFKQAAYTKNYTLEAFEDFISDRTQTAGEKTKVAKY